MFNISSSVSRNPKVTRRKRNCSFNTKNSRKNVKGNLFGCQINYGLDLIKKLCFARPRKKARSKGIFMFPPISKALHPIKWTQNNVWSKSRIENGKSIAISARV